jgi:hypothetical protein
MSEIREFLEGKKDFNEEKSERDVWQSFQSWIENIIEDYGRINESNAYSDVFSFTIMPNNATKSMEVKVNKLGFRPNAENGPVIDYKGEVYSGKKVETFGGVFHWAEGIISGKKPKTAIDEMFNRIK